MIERQQPFQPATSSLVDILDRVLDKGLVVAGDIRISVANVELLTVKIRLLVCSVDKAEEIGLDWWRRDEFLSAGAGEAAKATERLEARVEELEQRLAGNEAPAPQPPRRAGGRLQSGGDRGS
ncbi:MAG: gas vesicle protein [Chloroflexi bacterium]|nr:gas vesicle protein [Chloroflexota bacterium]